MEFHLPEIAQEIIQNLQWEYNVVYDEKDAVGRRYRRQDALGTPFCITIDHQTNLDNLREHLPAFEVDANAESLEGRVAFRYTESVNGSRRDIAGVLNAAGNVLGMMPHPERAVDAAHGGKDGVALFEGVVRL